MPCPQDVACLDEVFGAVRVVLADRLGRDRALPLRGVGEDALDVVAGHQHEHHVMAAIHEEAGAARQRALLCELL